MKICLLKNVLIISIIRFLFFDFKVEVFELKNNIVLNLKPTYFYKDSYSFYEKSAVFQPPKYS